MADVFGFDLSTILDSESIFEVSSLYCKDYTVCGMSLLQVRIYTAIIGTKHQKGCISQFYGTHVTKSH